MNCNELQGLINKSDYFDSRVENIECNYFGDEVVISFNNGKKDIKIFLEECYKVQFDHIKEYSKIKPLKLYTTAQIPFFLQDIEVTEEGGLYYIRINAFPLYMEINCKKVKIM